MRLTKIEWKNIFSYGNELNSLSFDTEGCLWQLCGLSGAGKTSIIQLPYLLLYGETINGVKLPGIPNRNNVKDSMVRGYVKNGDNEYIITRMFKPHTITIEKNGVNIDLPGIDAKQEYIRNEVMNGIPKNIYKNILTLSLNTDISFIDMGAKDKRSIVDFLLDMEILNYYSELLKKDNSNVTQSINESNGSINVLDRSILRAKGDLENKRQILAGNIKTEVPENEIREKIQTIETDFLAGRRNYIVTMNNEIRDFQSKKTSIVNERAILSTKIQQCNNQLNLLNADKCPTCGSSFKTDSFDNIRATLTDYVTNESVKLKSYDEAIAKIDADVRAKYDEISKINNEINLLNDKVKSLNDMILLSERYNTAKMTYETAQNEVNRLESEKKEELCKVGEREHDVYLLGILKNVYSDSGVKKVLREKYVPELNREINLSLERLNIPYRMEFDNNFEAVLYDRGEKVQIETLSGGEKQRANIAVLYSLIKIVKNKYPQINIVALDETTSHIDPENGMDSFRFLKSVAEELNLNIIIVTHNEIIDDSIFKHRLFIEKRSGFSEITFK